jgi:hypothetical protein
MPEGDRPRFRRPGRDHRAAIIGRTGTGKTVFALWLLSEANIDKRPWLIVDYKGERLFDRIGRRALKELRPGAKVPKRPGLYYMQPVPRQDDAAMEETFWHIWDQENVGLYFDEVLQVPDCAAFESLLVQGRSKHIQMILCNQRPYDLSTYVLTQSDFIAAFPVQRVQDQRCLEEYLGRSGIMRVPRAKRHSVWLDVEEGQLMELDPVPPPDHILARLNDRAPRALWWGI